MPLPNISAADLPRPTQRDVARALADKLKKRRKKGPKEEALDAFLPELADVAARLGQAVGQGSDSDATRKALLAKLDQADDDVDRWLRHVESYIAVEARRRTAAEAPAARALHDTAFPSGIAHVDAAVNVENALCRNALAVLRAPENASTVRTIGLPSAWLDAWSAALDASDAVFADVEKARASKHEGVQAGQDAEVDFVETCVRLRRYLGSRAKRTETDKIAENRALLDPLTAALAKLRTKTLSRAAKKKRKEEEAAADADGAREADLTTPSP